jgi:hypothetical protein
MIHGAKPTDGLRSNQSFKRAAPFRPRPWLSAWRRYRRRLGDIQSLSGIIPVGGAVQYGASACPRTSTSGGSWSPPSLSRTSRSAVLMRPPPSSPPGSRRRRHSEILEKFEDCETKSDQRRTRSDPRHQGSFLSQARALRRETSGCVERLLCHGSCSAFALRRRHSARVHRPNCHHHPTMPHLWPRSLGPWLRDESQAAV